MARRTSALLCAALFLFAACSSDKKTSTPASTSSGGEVVTVQVGGHGSDAATNFDGLKYYPDAVTVAAGSTVRFKEALGEPHTVSFGTSIDTMAKYIKDHPDALQSNGPPPKEIQDLQVPFLFPFPEGDGPPKIRQAVAQPCVTKAGEFVSDDGLPACANKSAGTLDGTSSIINSGLFIQDAQTYDLKVADDLAPGTYTWICQFHGPEMRGTLTVVPKGDKSAQSAADVDTARKKALDTDIATVKTAVDKAKADAKPGEVKAAPAPDNSPLYAGVFAPSEIDVKVGDTVKWNLSFHTVTFNAPEDAHLFLVKAPDGSIEANAKGLSPAGYTPPTPTSPPSTSPPDTSGSAASSSEGPPPATEIDGGSWDGTGYYNSGSANAEGDVFFSLKFTKAGTYKYICTIHPDMEGTVKVS